MKPTSDTLSRRSLLTQAAVAGIATMAAPMINLGRFRLFAQSTAEYSARAVALMQRSLVIDMLSPFTLNFPNQAKWEANPESFSARSTHERRCGRIWSRGSVGRIDEACVGGRGQQRDAHRPAGGGGRGGSPAGHRPRLHHLRVRAAQALLPQSRLCQGAHERNQRVHVLWLLHHSPSRQGHRLSWVQVQERHFPRQYPQYGPHGRS